MLRTIRAIFDFIFARERFEFLADNLSPEEQYYRNRTIEHLAADPHISQIQAAEYVDRVYRIDQHSYREIFSSITGVEFVIPGNALAGLKRVLNNKNALIQNKCLNCANYVGTQGGNWMACAMYPYGYEAPGECPDKTSVHPMPIRGIRQEESRLSTEVEETVEINGQTLHVQVVRVPIPQLANVLFSGTSFSEDELLSIPRQGDLEHVSREIERICNQIESVRRAGGVHFDITLDDRRRS